MLKLIELLNIAHLNKLLANICKMKIVRHLEIVLMGRRVNFTFVYFHT